MVVARRPPKIMRADGHAVGIVGLGRPARIVAHGRGEAAVGMGGLFLRFGRPFLPSPVEALGGHGAVLAFPPDIEIGCEGDVGVDRVALDHLGGVGIGLAVGSGHDAEIAGLGIDGVETPVRAGFHPGDVVADGPDLPVLEVGRRDHHGEVGFAAGAGEGGGDVGLFAVGRLHTDDQHVLGQPALLSAQIGTDAQGEAFLAEQGIAAVSGADGDDGVVLGEMAM